MPWRCSSLMIRRSVQWPLYRDLLTFAVLGAGFVVSTAGVAAAAGVEVAAGGGVVVTAAGRSTYFGASVAGTASRIWVAAVAGAGCAASDLLVAASERLRGPAACADAETRTRAAIKAILRMCLSRFWRGRK